MLTLQNCHIELNQQPLVQDLSFSVQAGKVLSLMGPSGCGKSTLLNYLCGTLDPMFRASGQLSLGTTRLEILPVEKRHVGVLYQSPLLFPHMNNLENLMFAIPAHIRGKLRKELAMNKLHELGLEHKACDLPSNLSGGQQARVALLRTLLSEPDYLLLDEPFGKLDTTLRQSVREFVLEQVQNSQLPTVLVTHDHEDAKAMGGKVLMLT